MHPAFTKMSHFLCACLPVLFPSQHSQQDHTSCCGYGDPDQRERIPCLGHSRRRCGRTGRRAPRAAGRRAGRGRCVCRRTARPARRSGRRGAAAFGARLRLCQYIQAQMCQLRIQQAVCCFCRQQFFFALRAYVIQLRFGCVKALGKRERHIQHAARLHRAAIQQQRNIKCRKVNIFIAESARHRSICRVARIHRLHLEMRAGRHCVQPCRQHGSLLHCPPR